MNLKIFLLYITHNGFDTPPIVSIKYTRLALWVFSLLFLIKLVPPKDFHISRNWKKDVSLTQYRNRWMNFVIKTVYPRFPYNALSFNESRPLCITNRFSTSAALHIVDSECSINVWWSTRATNANRIIVISFFF